MALLDDARTAAGFDPIPHPSATGRRITSPGFNRAEHADLDPGHWWMAGRSAIFSDVLAKWLPRGSRLLDVGCGGGLLTAVLNRRYDLDSVDVSPEAVALAVSRGAKARVVGPNEPFAGRYDGVIALDVMEHVADDLGFARRLAAVLDPGGLAVLSVPAFGFLWSPMDAAIGHYRRYRRPQLAALVRAAGIEPVHVSYFNSLLFPPIAALRLFGIGDGGGDVELPPAVLNAALSAVFRSERRLVNRLPMPFGVSLLLVGRRTEDPDRGA